jgi:hypothetical protein
MISDLQRFPDTHPARPGVDGHRAGRHVQRFPDTHPARPGVEGHRAGWRGNAFSVDCTRNSFGRGADRGAGAPGECSKPALSAVRESLIAHRTAPDR